MRKEDYINDSLEPDVPESGYNYGRPETPKKKLPWWERLWNWLKKILDELFQRKDIRD